MSAGERMDAALFTSFVIVAALGAIFAWVTHNNLNQFWHHTNEARANIEVVLNKRRMLTARLIEIAGQYVGHERLIHLQVSADRTRAGQVAATGAGQAGPAIAFFAGLAADFPALRADQTYLRLMSELTILEGEVQNRYEIFNAAARKYNEARMSLPTVLLAGSLGFNSIPYLEPTTPPPTLTNRFASRLRIRNTNN